MQERKVVVSRVIKSARLFPQIKESPAQRIAKFVDAQRQVVAYPFSPDISIKSLGRSTNDPSADNKEKRKKAKSKFMRMGTAIFDPNATAKPGQYFETRPRKINQDGQLGDVPNVGWLFPREKMSPERAVETSKQEMLKARNRVGVRVVPAQKNKRTGAMEAKALGRTIGQAIGNVGQAAARAVGIVVDPDGRFRCPPGVPAANQFTDEVGSNCFDFSPLVARALVGIAQRFGQNLMQSISRIDAASPFQRDREGGLSFSRPGAGERGVLRSSGGLLGPDGKPISMETIAAEELAEAEMELRKFSRGTGEIVDPETYEAEFEKALRAAYPELSDVQIREMAGMAARRERMKDSLRKQQREAMEIARSFGISVDESDPVSVQRAMALSMKRLRDEGWDIDLRGYYGDSFHDDPEMALLQHGRRLSSTALMGVEESINMGRIDGFSKEQLDALYKRYGSNLSERIAIGMQDGKLPAEIFPDDERAQDLMAMATMAYSKAQSYEIGAMMQMVRQRVQSPRMMDDIKEINLVKPNPDDMFFGECGINPSTGKLMVNLDVFGMLVFQPPKSMKDSGFHLYEPSGTAGTEIAKLQAIGEVVSAENRARLLGSYLGDLRSFQSQIDAVKKGQGFMTDPMADQFGGMAHGQFVMYHELMHGRQLKMVAEFVRSRNPGMTNVEALDAAQKICIEGRTYTDASGMDFDYAEIISNPSILRNAIGNLDEIIYHLIDNRVGGAYGPSHYYTAFYMNEISKGSSIEEMAYYFEQARRRMEQLAVTDPNGAEREGLGRALNQASLIVESARANGFNEVKAVRDGVQKWAGITFMEMQADIAAGLEMGLIEKTPEIEAFLAPLNIGKDIDAIRENIVPNIPSDMDKESKLKKIARIGKRIKKINYRDIGKDIEDLERISALAEAERASDASLMSTGLRSTAVFDGRGDVSRWGKATRDIAMESATEAQKKIIEGDWRSRRWSKPHNDNTMLNSLALGGGQKIVEEIENEYIPFIDLISNSTLPNGVAAEIVMPGGSIGLPGQNIRGNRYAIDNHFTGLLKSTDNLLTSEAPEFPLDSQRIILNVPEGYSGLPDFTPGTNRSEVGSIILPPGEIEIVGMRDDGVAIARLVSQEKPLEAIAKKKAELERVEAKTNSLEEKIQVRRAINRLERSEQGRAKNSLRSTGKTNETIGGGDRTKIPSEQSKKTSDVKDRLESQGIKFGKPNSSDRASKRKEEIEANRPKTGMSVPQDGRKWESAEEAKQRVAFEIDRAVELISEGKLQGLSPEVAETLKGKTSQQIREMLVSSARSYVEGLDKRPRFRIRGSKVRDVQDAREIPLMGFLKTGKYLTTYDADAAGVAPSSRAADRVQYEVMLGIPENADDSLRPAHGFYKHIDEIEFGDDWAKEQIEEASKRDPNGVSFRDYNVLPPASGSNNQKVDSDGVKRAVDSLPYQYGDSEIVLRQDVSQRAVATFGDSFAGYRTPIQLDGSSSDDELLEAMILNRANALTIGEGMTQQRRIANLLNSGMGRNHAHTTEWSEGNGERVREYTEAIVAGSFDMDDVEEIRISPQFQESSMQRFAIKPNEVGNEQVRELLQGFMPQEDLELAMMLVGSPQQDPAKKAAAQAIRELIAVRLSLVKNRAERNRIRQMVVSSSGQNRIPKVTFLDRNGVNIDDHRTFAKTMSEVDMNEDNEIDDIVRYGTAKRVRDAIASSGETISSNEKFAALKPKPKRSPDAAKPNTQISAGTLIIDEPEPPRRMMRRLDEGRQQVERPGTDERILRLADMRRERISREGQQATLRLTGRGKLNAPERGVEQKLTQGPENLSFGRDQDGAPIVASIQELQAKFGKGAGSHERYFRKTHGIKLKAKVPKDPVEKEAYYGSLQGLDDILSNLNRNAMKGQRLTVRAGTLSTQDTDSMGEFARSRKIMFNVGRNAMSLQVSPDRIAYRAQMLVGEAKNGYLRNRLKQAIKFNLSAQIFVNQEAINSPDALNVVSRRYGYATMIHELGHMLDHLALPKNERAKMRTVASRLIRGSEERDAEISGSYLTGNRPEEFSRHASVTSYGKENAQEKLAEAFTAWWLYARYPDMPIIGTAGEGQQSYQVQGTIGGLAKPIVKPLLDALGGKVKTAEKEIERAEKFDKIPPLVLLYTMLPFIIMDKENS